MVKGDITRLSDEARSVIARRLEQLASGTPALDETSGQAAQS
jgi:hypothetical protein